MIKACNFGATGKWIWVPLLQLIILRRFVAESSDSCKNLSTGWKDTKVEEKNKKMIITNGNCDLSIAIQIQKRTIYMGKSARTAVGIER